MATILVCIEMTDKELNRLACRRMAARSRACAAPVVPSYQPVVEVTASTEGGEAPRGQGATTENIGPYLKKEQRSLRGCIAGRMPS